MISGIDIRGSVTIKTVSPNGKRTTYGKGHNTITKRLAEGLARFLVSEFASSDKCKVGENYAPIYIGVGTGTIIDPPFTPFTITDLVNPLYQRISATEVAPVRVPVTSREVGLSQSGDYVSVTITAFIPPAYIPTGTTINEVGLFSSVNGTTLLSRINLVENRSTIIVKAGYGIDVIWNLMISAGQSTTADQISNKTVVIRGKRYLFDEDDNKLIYSNYYRESGGSIVISRLVDGNVVTKSYIVHRSGDINIIDGLEDSSEVIHSVYNKSVVLDGIQYSTTNAGLVHTEEYSVTRSGNECTTVIDGTTYKWTL